MKEMGVIALLWLLAAVVGCAGTGEFLGKFAASETAEEGMAAVAESAGGVLESQFGVLEGAGVGSALTALIGTIFTVIRNTMKQRRKNKEIHERINKVANNTG